MRPAGAGLGDAVPAGVELPGLKVAGVVLFGGVVLLGVVAVVVGAVDPATARTCDDDDVEQAERARAARASRAHWGRPPDTRSWYAPVGAGGRAPRSREAASPRYHRAMVQRRPRLVSGLAVLISLLLLSGAAVAVTLARRGNGVRVRTSATRPEAQARSEAPTDAPAEAQLRPQPPPPAPSQQQPQPVSAPPESAAPPPQLGAAVIDVAVATLWLEPGQARPIDGPSLTNPADVTRWVSDMTVGDKLWLVGKLATQALYGDRVTVVGTSGGWAKVVVADQPSSLDPRGYPGWLPTVQLSQRPAAPGSDTAATGSPTGAELVRSAQAFTGVSYLWAGISPAGFDCSGLTWAVYRAHGIVIPRDAADQAGSGSPVDAAALQPGDLLFYASGPGQDSIHHVAMYVGNGTMIQSPATGRAVETVPVDTPEFAREFWGARRYVSS